MNVRKSQSQGNMVHTLNRLHQTIVARDLVEIIAENWGGEKKKFIERMTMQGLHLANPKLNKRFEWQLVL